MMNCGICGKSWSEMKHSYNQLIKRTFYSILMINALSSLSGIMCVIIDAIMTGQFLGTAAVAASGLITPVVTLSNLLCNILAPGLSIVCTRYMGKAQPERSCQVFSIVVIADVCLSGLYALVLFAAAPSISDVLGHAADVQILQMMTSYIRGYKFAAKNLHACVRDESRFSFT